jgi:NAD(P)-dependent dehydrogenase (short-subunit alcohol dehydrogenase family)
MSFVVCIINNYGEPYSGEMRGVIVKHLNNSDPNFPHRSVFGAVYSLSKTALNAITLAFAIELESTGIKINAVCPGFTGTDLNNFEGTRTVEQAAREPVRLALLEANGPTGTFSDEDGPLPW